MEVDQIWIEILIRNDFDNTFRDLSILAEMGMKKEIMSRKNRKFRTGKFHA